VKCVILLIKTAIRTVLCIISMARFPSNCDVILHQRCGKTNLSVCISTFGVITARVTSHCCPFLYRKLSQYTDHVPKHSVSTYIPLTYKLQSLRPVDSLYITYTLFYVILVIHVSQTLETVIYFFDLLTVMIT